MLLAQNLDFTVKSKKILSGIILEAHPGKLLAICGPNGSGKSTLLKILSGELKPTSGLVSLDDVVVHQIKPWQLAERRAVVPQATHLAFPFNVSEVVELGISIPRFALARSSEQQLVYDALRRVDMLELAERSYQTLSGGERQRVHLARAICQLAASKYKSGSRILFLDEPTASLDLAHQIMVLEEARRLANSGLIGIVVLHDLNLAAMYADTIYLLSAGTMAACGSADLVMNDSMLSKVFGCRIKTSHPPIDGSPYILPQLCTIDI